MNAPARQCKRCVMDTKDDPQLAFDADGVCSYCREYAEQEAKHVLRGAAAEQELARIVHRIKEDGRGKPHDCLVGVSGGVDSTFLALKAKDWGLRPLAFHFDNGWNSELAVSNIEAIVRKLGFELHTYVVDWEEFRDLQRAYLRASVVDIEALTDHAIIASMYKVARQRRLKHILIGTNVVTEAVLPSRWIHDKWDDRNIKSIHRQFGSVRLRSFPFFGRRVRTYYFLLGIRIHSPLNYIGYHKDAAKRELLDRLQWRDYGGKHYESVFTRFYQGYILPTKFGIDKRKAHLSTLICSGQMTRNEALEELAKPMYDREMLRTDMEFALKKLGFTREEFQQLMSTPPRAHREFDTAGSIYGRYPFLRPFKPWADRILHRRR